MPACNGAMSHTAVLFPIWLQSCHNNHKTPQKTSRPSFKPSVASDETFYRRDVTDRDQFRLGYPATCPGHFRGETELAKLLARL